MDEELEKWRNALGLLAGQLNNAIKVAHDAGLVVQLQTGRISKESAPDRPLVGVNVQRP